MNKIVKLNDDYNGEYTATVSGNVFKKEPSYEGNVELESLSLDPISEEYNLLRQNILVLYDEDTGDITSGKKFIMKKEQEEEDEEVVVREIDTEENKENVKESLNKIASNDEVVKELKEEDEEEGEED